MSTLTHAMADSATMLRRNLKHIARYPTVFITIVVMPVVFLLLFVYVFGGSMGAGLPGMPGIPGGRTGYANYLIPGILILTMAGGGQGTAISIAMDAAEGIVARFKTMAISRGAVLMGHVLGTMLQTFLGLAIMLGVAFLIGFRPNANAVEWLAVIGVLVLVSSAITWLCIACGLAAKSVETASNAPMPLLLLPFLGSGFAPTDSMPAAVRWFAEYQPFTPFTETLRGLLLGTDIGTAGVATVLWCVGITGLSYLWAMKLYNRDPSR